MAMSRQTTGFHVSHSDDLKEGCTSKQLMHNAIYHIAQNADIDLLFDVYEFINDIEGKFILENIDDDFDIEKENHFSTYPAQAYIIVNCKVGLLIDTNEEVIYFLDVCCRDLTHYPKVVSLIESQYKAFQIKNVPCADQTNFNPEKSSLFNFYQPVMAVLVWGLSKFYNNEYMWYIWLKKIVTHRDFIAKSGTDGVECLKQIDKNSLTYVNLGKEQEIVREIIKEAANEFMEISQLKAKLSVRYQNPIGKREECFIEEKYIKDCTAKFFDEASKMITNDIDKIVSNVSDFLDKIRNMKEIPVFLKDAKSYKIMVQCIALMTKHEYKTFIENLKSHCLESLLTECDTLNSEIAFINETKRVLRQFFVYLSSDDDSEKSKVNAFLDSYNKAESDIRHVRFIQFLQNSKHSELLNLKQKALYLDVDKPFHIISQELAKLFASFNEPVKRVIKKESYGKALIFEGSFIRLDDIKRGKEELNYQNIYEIQVIASQLICVNTHIKFPGTNIVLAAPSIFINQEHYINVSGIDGNDLYNKRANDGEEPGDDGLAGEPGDNGQDGGNVYICAEEISNSQDLKIISCGGDGGKGQDGGNGADGINGKDGKEISTQELDKSFPDGASLSSFFIGQLVPGVDIITDILSDSYSKLTVDGCTVIYSNYSAGFWTEFISWFGYPKLQSYCIHYGGQGTPGKRGGMGGRGGKAGSGGSVGNIDINCKNHLVLIKRKNGNIGKTGKDGVGGKGGYNGRKGFDTARLTPSQYRDARYYGPARLKLRYVNSKDADVNTAYCPYTTKLSKGDRYAKIEKVSQTRRASVRAHGQRVEKSEKRQRVRKNEARHHQKSVMISKNMINEKYSQILKASYNSDMKAIDLTMIRSEIVQTKAAQLHTTEITYKLESSHNYPKVHTLPARYINTKDKDGINAQQHVVSFADQIKDEICVLQVHLKDKPVLCEDNHSITVEEVRLVKKHLQTNALGSPRFIATIAEYIWQMRIKIGKKMPLRVLKKISKKQESLEEKLYKELNVMFEIVLMKYKFAILEQISGEVRKLEQDEQNRTQIGKRRFLESIIKMRLIHLNFDTVKGCLYLFAQKDIFKYSEIRKREIYTELRRLYDSVKRYENELTIIDENELEIEGREVDKVNDDSNRNCTDVGEENCLFEEREIQNPLLNPVQNEQEIQNEKVEDDKKTNELVSGGNRRKFKRNILGKITKKHKPLHDEPKHRIALIDHITDSTVFQSFYNDQQNQFTETLSKIQSIDDEKAQVLFDAIRLKIFVDGIHLSGPLFDLLISEVTAQGDTQTIKIFTWIITTTHMSKWMAEYTVQQAIYKGCLEIKDENKMRSCLYQFQDTAWIPAVWRYIFNENVCNLPDCYSTLKLIEDAEYDNDLMYQLDNTDPNEWRVTLKDYFAYKNLWKLPVDWTDDTATEADVYLDELQKIYGEATYDDILEALKNSEENIKLDDVMLLLRNFYHDYWQPTSDVLGIIRRVSSSEWEKTLNEIFQPDRDRSLSELINLMKNNTSNSFNLDEADKCGETSKDVILSKELDEVRLILENSLTEGKAVDTFGEEFVKNWEHDFDRKIATLSTEEKKPYIELVTKWSNEVRKRVKGQNRAAREIFLAENINEIFSHVEIGISLVKKFKLRQTQRLSTLLLAKSKSRGLLAQVATGEGKTIIIVAFCIIKNLLGQNFDVVTSSLVLAKRDSSDNEDVYKVFGTTVSNNCSDDEEKRTEAYKKNIVYGEIGSIQRDILLQQCYNKNILGKRGFPNIVVDEVDSMLLDKAENVLYLSHDIADLDTLEPLFVYIWTFVNGKGMVGTEDDIDQVHAALMNAMYGSIRKKDLGNYLDFKSDSEVKLDKIWQYLIDEKIIDSKYRILPVKELKNNQLNFSLPQELKTDADGDIEGSILSYLKNVIRQGIHVIVPNYLEEFISIHLLDWIKSAFTARFLQERQHYIIDINRGDMETGKSANIVIMDTDTGMEQFNMQWSEALHIFLQLKHCCRISLETLKAVFISNIEFFKLYQPSIYGLTGTLGSKQERDILQELYNVNYVTVPTFRQKRFLRVEDNVFADIDKWIEETTNNAIHIAEKRPVLMICETIKELDMFDKYLRMQQQTKLKVYVYKHSYEELDIVKNNKQLENGCIILATNLAGRGTDIKISKKISEEGGLHVILTYMPRNIRISEQAFGRAARKGEKGSGQFSIVDSQSDQQEINPLLRIVLLAKNRNAEEQIRLNSMIKHYESFIKVEEIYFKKFQGIFKSIKASLTTEELKIPQTDVIAMIKFAKKKKEMNSKKEIILQACLDHWAFWLDSLNNRLANDIKDSESHWMKFKAKIEEDFDISCVPKMTKSPSQIMKLGKIYIKEKQFEQAIELFENLCEQEPNFSESAHYYTSHCLVKKSNLDNKIDKKKFIFHLQKADEILQRKMDVYSEINSMVNAVKSVQSDDINNFIACDSYERQKTDQISIMEAFKRTVSEMLGQGIEIQMLINVAEDSVLAKRIFESRDILQPSLMTNDDDDLEFKERELLKKNIESLYDRYELYCTEIKQKIEVRDDTKELKSEDFEGIIPSREEFWKILKEKSLISEEREFVIINKEKLDSASELPEKISNKISQLKSCKDYDEMSSTPTKEETLSLEKEERNKEKEPMVQICMFPEHIDDIKSNKLIAIGKTEAKEIDSILLETLECYDAILTNKIAFLNKADAKSTNLGKFDGISKENFLEIKGVNMQTAEELHNLVQPYLEQCSIPRVEEIDMQNHRKYDTEVANLLDKYHKYRSVLLETLKTGVIPYEVLTSSPHKLIWKDMIDLKIISPILVQPDVDEDKAQKLIDDELNLVKSAYNSFCYFFDFKEKSKFASSIYEWKAGIHKFEIIDSELKDIREIIDKKTLKNADDELNLLTARGFDEVITLIEKKWSWTTIFKIIGIILIGLAQIALGVILEVFTLGGGTFVAGALIGEGIGDIMFAIEAAISGHCSMKEYLKHKVLSISITVLTAGVGAFFAKGAAFSRFGCKILGKQAAKTVGKDLVKEVGKRRIAKEVSKRIGKKVAEATALGLATAGIDHAVEKLLRGKLEEICKSVVSIFRAVQSDDKLKVIIKTLCEKLGPDRARVVVMEISNKSMHSQIGNVNDKVIKVCSAVSDGMDKAMKRLDKQETAMANKRVKILTEFGSIISKCMKFAPYVNALFKLKETCKGFLWSFERDLQTKLDTLESHEQGQKYKGNEQEDILLEVEEQLCLKMEEILSNELLKPILQHHTNKFIMTVGKSIKKSYRDIETKIQSFKFKRTDKDDHQALLKAQRKVKNPELYAKMLREGVPMGLHEAQAISNETNTKLKIIVCGGDGRRALPENFTPSSGQPHGPEVVLYLHVGKDGATGHFSDTPNLEKDHATPSKTGKNNCLLDVVSKKTGMRIDRNRVAHIVENDPVIRDNIKRGIHQHYIEIGGTGGAIESPEEKRRITGRMEELKRSYEGEVRKKQRKEREGEEMRRRGREPEKGEEPKRRRSRSRGGFRYEEQPIEFVLGEGDKKALRSDPQESGRRLTDSSVINAGNHEAFAIAKVPEWIHRDMVDERLNRRHDFGALEAYTWCDLHVHDRLDIPHVVFDHQGMQGHPIAIASDKDFEPKHQRTSKSATIVHRDPTDAIMRTSSPPDALRVSLQEHLNAIGSKADFEAKHKLDPTYFNNCFTATGHDLSNPQHREEFFTGLERTRYKIAAVLEKVGGEKNTIVLENTEANKQFVNKLKTQLQDAKNIEHIGDIIKRRESFD